MKSYPINFKDFKDVYAHFSYYINGNICLEVYAGDVMLCELSACLKYHVSHHTIVLKDTANTGEFINELMRVNLVTTFSYLTSSHGNIYVCRLSSNAIDDLEVGTRVAMAGSM